MVAVTVVVVLVVVVLLELGHARLDLAAAQDALGRQEPLDRGEPALVVAPVAVRAAVLVLPLRDLGDQLLPEALPLEGVALREGDCNAERAALPGRLEDELAVRARRRRCALRIGRECGRDRALRAHG